MTPSHKDPHVDSTVVVLLPLLLGSEHTDLFSEFQNELAFKVL